MSKVFISYSHDSAQHDERVLQFANALLGHGVEVELDRYHVRPPKGWPHWCEEQLRPEESDFVLMICTETYLKRVQGQVPVDEGLGVFWEGSIINHYIFDTKDNQRFIPVLLDGATKDFIPIPIREHARYHIARFDLSDSGYESLYRELTGRPLVTKPPLGQTLPLPTYTSSNTISPLAPRPVQTTFPVIAASRLFRSTSAGSDLLVGREAELTALDRAWSGARKKNVVTIVAWGGVGKTSLVARWAANTLAKENHGGIERYFDWSFYSQGTRTEGDATGVDKAASADIFVKDALEFFGDPDLAASNVGAWQKGERLARLVAEHCTLLILDGIEPLQDAKSGDLRDQALRALLRGLAANNPGLCLVTTRQRLPELNSWHTTTAPQRELLKLSKEAGAELLKKLGVNGALAEREQLAADVKGHGLTLTLLGKYLAEAHGGDIRKRDLVSLAEADYEETSGHAFHVMAAYERWLEKDDRHVELAILRLLGLFDRPATPDCLSALRQAPVIIGLTDTLAPLSEAQWNVAVRRLVQLGLIEEQPWESRHILGYNEDTAKAVWVAARFGGTSHLSQPKIFVSPHKRSVSNRPALDTHGLIREYFASRLRGTQHRAWRAAHSRLFEYLGSNAPYWPNGLDGLEPLYQAIAHGCQAGRYEEALADIYRDRILRGTFGQQAFYSTKNLGALGTDLAAISDFFLAPWTRPVQGLNGGVQSWLLGMAAGNLRAVGRLAEARDAMIASLNLRIEQKNWAEAANLTTNLSELDLTLGDVTAAVSEAKQSVAFADRCGLASPPMLSRTAHADALHQAGRKEEALKRFKEAEAIQLEWKQSQAPQLYSLQGFQFCDLLLADAERVAWRAITTSKSLRHSDEDFSPLVSNVSPTCPEGDANLMATKALDDVEQRACRALPIAMGLEWLLDIALYNLTLSRTAFYRSILEAPTFDFRMLETPRELDDAVNGLRQAGQLHFVPLGFLTRAWLRALQGRTLEARADLDEAQQIAERGPMPLHLADVHLHRARLFFREDPHTAREELEKARVLIEKHGYLRRMPELEDTEQVILGQ